MPGNHEFYGARLQDVLAALREAGNQLEISVPMPDAFVCEGVRALDGFRALWPRTAANRSCDADAQYGMNDFRLIRYGSTGLFAQDRPATYTSRSCNGWR
jgi:hypothetical protein